VGNVLGRGWRLDESNWAFNQAAGGDDLLAAGNNRLRHIAGERVTRLVGLTVQSGSQADTERAAGRQSEGIAGSEKQVGKQHNSQKHRDCVYRPFHPFTILTLGAYALLSLSIRPELVGSDLPAVSCRRKDHIGPRTTVSPAQFSDPDGTRFRELAGDQVVLSRDLQGSSAYACGPLECPGRLVGTPGQRFLP